MNILLTYGTYSNSTYSASVTLQQSLESKGHLVTMVDACDVTVDQMKTAEVIIFASPSWDHSGHQGMPHEHYTQLMQIVGDQNFPGKLCAVMGLGDSSYTYFCGAVAHLEEFVRKIQGTLIVSSLKIDQYYMDESHNTKEIQAWAEAIEEQLKS